MHLRHFAANDSVFLDDAYLIKGVAGAILWKLLKDFVQHGRTEFSNRELRLDTSIRLPDVTDNLEARLVLLRRRLAEHGPNLRIEKTGRGRFRLVVLRPVVLDETPCRPAEASARASLAHSFSLRCGRTVSRMAWKAGAGAFCAHAGQHAHALGRVHERHHPARDHHHLGRGDGRDQAVVDLHQLGVGVAGPQHGVVRGFLHVHVVEVVGDEEGQLSVQRLRGGGALRGRAGAQRGHGRAERGDVALVLLVLVGDALARAGRARLDRGMHELVLVLQVRGAEVQQLEHALGGLGEVQVVFHVHAAHGQQGVGHQRADRLVDAAVHVHARRRAGRELLHFFRIDLHAGFSLFG